MKASTLVALFAASMVHAHTIFQKVSVNGVDQGQLKGVRAPSSNNPIQNVNDGGMACNNGIQYKDNNIINIPAGARVGAWWGHVIGGPQGSNDPDNPIAASHKGPLIAYLAKVDNAATTGTSGLRWFKIAEDGFDGSQWGVDRLISSGGWHYFTLPQCIAPGNYLLRAEIIALHSAYSAGGAQFYMGCAQINVTGGGSATGTDLISLPGGYSSSHPGITVNIYGTGGVPNNGGKPYSIPGPSVVQCNGSNSGGGGGGGQQTTTANPQPTGGGGGGGGSVALYGQCGGNGYSGPTTCAQGTCKATNEWYSQCVP